MVIMPFDWPAINMSRKISCFEQFPYTRSFNLIGQFIVAMEITIGASRLIFLHGDPPFPPIFFTQGITNQKVAYYCCAEGD